MIQSPNGRGAHGQGFARHLPGIRQAQQDVLADAAGEEHWLLGRGQVQGPRNKGLIGISSGYGGFLKWGYP